jgi:hypothetical protein
MCAENNMERTWNRKLRETEGEASLRRRQTQGGRCEMDWETRAMQRQGRDIRCGRERKGFSKPYKFGVFQ